MNIDPADSAAVQRPPTNKGNNFVMWHEARLTYLFVHVEKLPAPTSIADQQLPVDELMAHDFIPFE